MNMAHCGAFGHIEDEGNLGIIEFFNDAEKEASTGFSSDFVECTNYIIVEVLLVGRELVF